MQKLIIYQRVECVNKDKQTAKDCKRTYKEEDDDFFDINDLSVSLNQYTAAHMKALANWREVRFRLACLKGLKGF